MQLIDSIKNLLADVDIPADEREDVILDAQEYGLGEMIALIEDSVSEEKLMELEKLVENEASVQEIDTWLSENTPNYIDNIDVVLSTLQEYLESDDMGEEE